MKYRVKVLSRRPYYEWWEVEADSEEEAIEEAESADGELVTADGTPEPTDLPIGRTWGEEWAEDVGEEREAVEVEEVRDAAK